MMKKTCPKCGRTSYSSTEFMLLFCRYCDASLQGVQAELADAKSEVKECFWCGERMAKLPNGDKVCMNCGWCWRNKAGEPK